MPDNNFASSLSELIGDIYDCVLEPHRWRSMLTRVRYELNFIYAELGLLALPTHESLVDITSSAMPAWLKPPRNRRDYSAMWGKPDDLTLPVGEPIVLSRFRKREEWSSSSIYKAAGKLFGVHDIVTVLLARDATSMSCLSFVRHISAGDVTEHEVKFLSLLSPHLQRAVAISRLLEKDQAVSAILESTLESLAAGVVVTDERGTIGFANRAARHMISNGGPLRSARGHLSVDPPEAEAELRHAIRLASANEATIGKTGLAVRLTELDTTPVFAHVLPMNGSEIRSRIMPNAAAAVFVRLEPDAKTTATTIAKTYQLTPAETRVLESLLEGRTLSETSKSLHIGQTTAKSHLDNIFEKTGVNRQTELIRLAARMQPPVGPLTC